LKSINYLHYGNGLESLLSFIDGIDGVHQKIDLVNSISTKCRISDFAIDIINAYNGQNSPSINVFNLKEDLISSLKNQLIFRQLNCRGFSYHVTDKFDFSYKLDSTINFKLALLSNKSMYYPPRLRKYLPRPHRNHIRERKYPSIAFSLGRIIDNKLYIIVMQSDLFFNGPSYVREYIKGWRKVLFYEILEYAKDKFDDIYLCTSEDIVKTCHPDYNRPKFTPEIWVHTYDKTAQLFNMQLTKLTSSINIQVLNDLPPEYANCLYYLNLQK